MISSSLTRMELDLRLATLLFVLIICPNLVLSCPSMQCASIISKCQLIDSCRCNAELDYSCYKNCSHCLGDLYAECCSCVAVCPIEDETTKPRDSHVKMFEPANGELFDLFTDDSDSAGRWHVYTEPVVKANSSTVTNCSMAFLSSCVDMYKCESSCIALGSYGFRWFHVGCCECVGKYCPNFGINEIRCQNCPIESERVMDSSD